MPVDCQALSRRLAGRERRTLHYQGFQEAAVLVPIVVEPSSPERLIFTVRDGGLRTHAGQIAFPGGRRDPTDRDLGETARREAAEELGIDPRAAALLGMLDDVPTPSGFMITPVVAAVAGPLALAPRRSEVAATFLAVLDELRAPERYSQAGEVEFLGITYPMHQYCWESHTIWGATARILHQLLQLLQKN